MIWFTFSNLAGVLFIRPNCISPNVGRYYGLVTGPPPPPAMEATMEAMEAMEATMEAREAMEATMEATMEAMEATMEAMEAAAATERFRRLFVCL